MKSSRRRLDSLPGNDPWRTAAATLLRESGCTIGKFRKSTTGIANLEDPLWTIEVPEPRGPVSYATFVHEIGHQVLHRRRRVRPRWLEEQEAWSYALDSFLRFDLPGVEKATADARGAMAYSFSKALRRGTAIEEEGVASWAREALDVAVRAYEG